MSHLKSRYRLCSVHLPQRGVSLEEGHPFGICHTPSLISDLYSMQSPFNIFRYHYVKRAPRNTLLDLHHLVMHA